MLRADFFFDRVMLESFMTLRIELRKEIAARLAKETAARGVNLSAYVEALIEEFAATKLPVLPRTRVRRPSVWRGKLKVGTEFLEPLPKQELDLWE